MRIVLQDANGRHRLEKYTAHGVASSVDGRPACIIMTEKTKYIGFVEADAGLTVVAESPEEAEEMLENVNTGSLGPPKVRTVEEF